MRILLLVGLLFSSAASATGNDLSQRMGTCLAAQSPVLPFNGIVAASQGLQRWTQAAGYTDAGMERRIATNTSFRLASVGKIFTRVAIGQLIDAGSLHVTDSVRTYLPELPSEFQPVTVAQLLDHRSGVASLTHITPDEGPILAGAKTARDVVPLIARLKLEFAPGTKQAYSNGGFFLLGAVIESISGMSYRQVVERRILGPLRMTHTAFEPGRDAAVPMTTFGGPGRPPLSRPQPRLEMPAFKASPAGDVLSSAGDMGKLANALIGNRLLTPRAKVSIFPDVQGVMQIGQAGGSIGSNTDFRVFPDSKSWLVVLTNRDPPAGELMGKVLGKVLAGQPCRTLTPADLPSPFGGPPSPAPHRLRVSQAFPLRS